MLRRTISMLLACTSLVTACSSDGVEGDSGAERPEVTTTSERPSADAADEALLEQVSVTRPAADAAPTLGFDMPLEVTSTVRRLLVEGTGEAAVGGDTVVFDYLFLNGRDGSQIGSSYDRDPAEVVVDDALLPGLRAGLIGLTAGSQVLMAIAPSDAFAGQGDDPDTGIRADDTLLVHLDLHEVRPPADA